MHIFCEADKTLFTFSDETGETSTLTLDKSVADALSKCVSGGDVHTWIQGHYDGIRAGKDSYLPYISAIDKRLGNLSRRAIGDIIRLLATMHISRDIDDSDL